MTGKILLDTNIVIALFANEAPVIQFIEQADEIFIPSIGLGELYFSARKSVRVEENCVRIDALAASSAVLVCDRYTAQHYGDIKAQLRAAGTPIPENDLWIAALTQQHQLALATRDNHFQQSDKLVIKAW
jgi:tRNA(fMet)-specific endonuclease VapC